MLAWYQNAFRPSRSTTPFYQMPRRPCLRLGQDNAGRFSICDQSFAPITHMSRLRRRQRPIRLFSLHNTRRARREARPVLFHCPFMKKDLPRLTEFLTLLPERHSAAFEFRNDSWFDDDVYDALKAAGASLCLSEREDNAPPPLVETAPWGYVRLRLETYSDDDLQQWAAKLEATTWREIYVYFMHEPTAPAYAQTLMRFASSWKH